jgi:hypothetical protein
VKLAGAADLGRGILTIKDFILSHAIGIPITTEADDDQSLVLGHDRLVDVPAGDEMGEYDGTHGVRFGGGETVMERCVVGDVGRQ